MSRNEEIIFSLILISCIAILFFCGWIWPIIVEKIKEIKKRNFLKTVDENSDLYLLNKQFDSDCTPEFPEDLNQTICEIVGQESYRPCSVIQRHIIKFNINDKKSRNGHTLNSRSVNVGIVLSYLKEKPEFRYLEIFVKENLGAPFWDGRKMHEDYPRCHTIYYSHIEDFKNVWDNIMDCLYGIKKHDLKNFD